MIEIPEWLARLPKNACVSINEFANVLGVKTNTLQWRIENKTYLTPEPDFNSRVSRRDRMGRVPLSKGLSKGKGKNHWKAVTVRNHIRYLNRLEMEKSK